MVNLGQFNLIKDHICINNDTYSQTAQHQWPRPGHSHTRTVAVLCVGRVGSLACTCRRQPQFSTQV